MQKNKWNKEERRINHDRRTVTLETAKNAERRKGLIGSVNTQ